MQYQIDPRFLVQQIKNGQNPQQLLLTILQSQANTPMGANLLQLVREGNAAEIEKLARNLSAQSGVDFDTEFRAFRQMLGL